MKYTLIAIQISEAFPHDVQVNRRTIESRADTESIYSATEGEVVKMMRDGFALSNWHLFESKSEQFLEDAAFTPSSGKSAASLMRFLRQPKNTHATTDQKGEKGNE